MDETGKPYAFFLEKDSEAGRGNDDEAAAVTSVGEAFAQRARLSDPARELELDREIRERAQKSREERAKAIEKNPDTIELAGRTWDVQDTDAFGAALYIAKPQDSPNALSVTQRQEGLYKGFFDKTHPFIAEYAKRAKELAAQEVSEQNIDEWFDLLDHADTFLRGTVPSEISGDSESVLWDSIYNFTGITDAEFIFGYNEVYLPAHERFFDALSSADAEVQSAAKARLLKRLDTEGPLGCQKCVPIINGMLDSELAEIGEFIDVYLVQNDNRLRQTLFLEEKYSLEFEFDIGDSETHNFTKPLIAKAAEFGAAAQEADERTRLAQDLSRLMAYETTGLLSDYTAAFDELGQEGVAVLLANVKSEGERLRRFSAEVLFRLELGRVGVTDEGVEYLGKLYDLGKYNDPDFFVRRLNCSGLMAVLDGNEETIEGVFELDLFSDENVVTAEVRDLLSQELFLPKADETPEERAQREKYLRLFIENYEDIFSDDFFADTGVRINSLDLHEQGWFLLHYQELSVPGREVELNELKDFVSAYGELGLKAYLVLDYGGSGRELLDFASEEGASDHEKKQVFKNFYSIANEAMNWREVFGNVEAATGYGFAPQVHEAFIRKNAEFLKAAQVIAKGEGGDVTMPELLKNMDAVAFALRALKGLYEDDSSLVLQSKNTRNEYKPSADGTAVERVKDAMSSYVLVDEERDAKVVVTVRPQPTVKWNRSVGGESRINFTVTRVSSGEKVRIGFDLSRYGEYIGDNERPRAVSLDLGVGKPDREAGIWPSQRVGRVLELAKGEGGHNELSFKPEVVEAFPEIAEQFRGYVEAKFS